MSRFERSCLIAVSVLYAAPIVLLAIWAARAHLALRTVISVLLAAVLLASLVAGTARTWRRFFLIQFPLFLVGIGFAGYTYTYGIPPGRTLALILVDTSREEVCGFLSLPYGKWVAVLIAALAAGYWYLALHLPRRPIFVGVATRVSRIIVVLLLPSTLYSAWNTVELMDGIALNPSVGSLFFLAGQLPLARAELHGSRVHKIPYQAHRLGGEEVHILVVGESARRESWSAYGYQRQTTPYLDAMRGDVILLRDATADANLTEWAVPILLTGLTPQNFRIGSVRGNLLDLIKEAGYSTTWLDNQEIGISTAVGVTADRLVNPADFQASINGRHALDEVLLPAFREEIGRSGAARFIGIHAMGSHWEYYRRYPPRFQHFGDARGLTPVSLYVADSSKAQALVDAYDNTVLYTDWFVHEIIEQARKLRVPTTVVFFPDHGEDLQQFDGESGHGQPLYTPHVFKIPAFVWVNEAFRTLHPEVVLALQHNAGKEIRTHDLFFTMADIMGITWPGASAERSFASERFTPDAAMKFVAGGVLLPGPR